jgi:alpha/beta superfamily hydrolase
MAEERIFLEAEGFKIEGLFENLGGGKGMVISHPHPLYGGSMHNNVVKAVANAYREQGYSTLRFNFRGVGLSEGDYDNGTGEQQDVHAALRYLTKLGKTTIDLAGYSFGSWVNALGIDAFKKAGRLIMVSPPVDFIDFGFLKYNAKIHLVICGTLDDIAGYRNVERMLPSWNDKATFRVIEGADHFYMGYEDEIKRVIGEFLGRSD